MKTASKRKTAQGGSKIRYLNAEACHTQAADFKPANLVSSRRLLRHSLILAASATVLYMTGAQAATSSPLDSKHESEWVELHCTVSYLPARRTWMRQLSLRSQDQALTEVRVDQVKVHSFQVVGTTLLTAFDNERIQFDLDQMRWQSDFRGLASGQGSCELAEQALAH